MRHDNRRAAVRARDLRVAQFLRGIDVPFADNRKEAKDHGEGGAMVGAPVRGRVLIVDDVITAGTAVRETVAITRQAGGEPCGALIAMDRQERGQGDHSAVQEVQKNLGLAVISIICVEDLMEHLDENSQLHQHLPAMERYRQTYGV